MVYCTWFCTHTHTHYRVGEIFEVISMNYQPLPESSVWFKVYVQYTKYLGFSEFFSFILPFIRTLQLFQLCLIITIYLSLNVTQVYAPHQTCSNEQR